MKFKSTLLLFIFLFLKLGVAHALNHTVSEHEVDNCEYCLFIADSNNTQTSDIDNSSFEISNNFQKKLSKPQYLLYKNPIIIKEFYRYTFYNKPPPSLA
ncbi:MAG: hypothetical protein HWD82_03585 [Flavobacteriaceae bacterium]|nr:hypothetical protein [Flavobacteriaceae bacterium]